MTGLEVLLEEPSAKAFLEVVLPEVLAPGTDLEFRVFQGKEDLLRKLPNRPKGYSYYATPPKILVLVDRDGDDCLDLKRRLEGHCAATGLPTKTSVEPGDLFLVCNRIAVEELESWLLGDEDALRTVFPRVAPYAAKATYRDPDAIRGGTWEALERLLQRSGYYPSGLEKLACAAAVARHVKPERNRSRSFHVFVEGARSLAGS